MPQPTVRSKLTWFNIALRGLMEAGVVLGLAYWGVRAGRGAVESAIFGLAAPLVGFGLWGAVDFRWAGRWAEPLRLAQELVISGLAAWALVAAGAIGWGWALAALSIFHHGMVYALGDRLLRARPHQSRD